jgi:hypothetical protein
MRIAIGPDHAGLGIVKLMVLPGKYDYGVRGEGHFQGIGCPTVADLHAMSR